MVSNSNNNGGTLESWLWGAACSIRGEIDAAKFKDFILPLIFVKRISDVYDDELATLNEDLNIAEELVQVDHSLVRFYIPDNSRWAKIASQTTSLGEYITDALRDLAGANSDLQGVIDTMDFNQSTSGQRTITDESLKKLILILNKKKLGLKDVDADILGRAYEYLLRKFAEDSGQSAGEFLTPMEVAELMAYIIDPEQGEEIYDPTCGTAGLLIKSSFRFKEKNGNGENLNFPRFFGQERTRSTFVMAKMNAIIHDMQGTEIALGDTMIRPAFRLPDGTIKTFNKVAANPMWNQKINESIYENDAYGRFQFGYPPSDMADWGWIQHMFASLSEYGKLVIVIDTGSVSRGSSAENISREKEIRKKFVDRGFIESVILLPENLFYNTTSAGVIITIQKNQRQDGKVLMINASRMFKKGKPKNFIPIDKAKEIFDIYTKKQDVEGLSKMISHKELIKADYNLNPSRFVSMRSVDELTPIEDIIPQLRELVERRKKSDTALNDIFEQLGFEGYINGN